MSVKLFLSQSDTRPMYLQIMTQIKQKVMVGDWPAGFHLPSIRELASAVGVSVITVKRAYLELEREGVIFTQQGKGSFIAHNEGLRDELKYTQLDEKVAQLIELAKQVGLSKSEFTQRLQEAIDLQMKEAKVKK